MKISKEVRHTIIITRAYVVCVAEVDGPKHLEKDFTCGALVEAGRMSL